MLTDGDRIDIRCDLNRRLAHTDPFDRQLVVGFGCMLELLRIAAAERGYAVTITPFPDGEPTPRLDARRVATAVFRRDPTVVGDPLADSILNRRSTKTVYNERAIPADRVADLLSAGGVMAGGTIAPDRVRRLSNLAWAAWMTEYETARTRRESIDLMRIGNAEVAANPDGIELSGIGIGLAGMAGVVTRDALDRPGSAAYAQGIAMFEPIIRSAVGFVWLTSPANRRADQLTAGRNWVRMNLAASGLGVAVHPLSQALQEFPEMERFYRAVHAELGTTEGAVVQMFGRIGYADAVAPTPRWPLESRMIS